MGALDGFYATWEKARENYGQDTPKGGVEFDASANLESLGAYVKAAAPGANWTGDASQSYDAANTKQGNALEDLASLDKRMGYYLDQSARVVVEGRRDLDGVRDWVKSMASYTQQGPMGEEARWLIAMQGLDKVTEIIEHSHGDLQKISENMRADINKYGEIGAGNSAAKEQLPEYVADLLPEYYDKTPEELTSEEGRTDGESLADGMLSPAQRERLLEAGNIDRAQLGALAAGEKVNVGADRMAYLYQLSQSMNGMPPEKIKSISQSLPEDERTALAQGLALISNPNAESGVPNTGGPNDENRASFVPAAGSLGNLPDTMVQELTRGDRVEAVDTTSDPNTTIHPDTHNLNGVGAMQDIATILEPAGSYLSGNEASRSMLEAVQQYAEADIKHRIGYNELSISDVLNSDHHSYPGSPIGDTGVSNALADIVHAAAGDHVNIHDLVTGEKSDAFLRAMTGEHWGDKSGDVGDAFRWAASDPHNPLNAETANEIAHFLSREQNDLLQHMPGTDGQTFGTINPELTQAMAEALTPYLPQLAGAEGQSGFAAAGIENFNSRDEMARMYSVFAQDHDAGVAVTNATINQQHLLQTDAAAAGPAQYQGETIAERLKGASYDGAKMAQEYDMEHKQYVASLRENNANAAWDKAAGAVSAFGALPQTAVPAAVGSVLTPIFKDALIDPTDPTTIEGDDYLVRHFENSPVNTVTAEKAAILQGLMNSNEEMSNDPDLRRFLTDGELDPKKFSGGSTTGESLSAQFDAIAQRWGYEAGIWADRTNDGDGPEQSWK